MTNVFLSVFKPSFCMFLTQSNKMLRLFFMHLSNYAKLKLTKKLKSIDLVLESFMKLIHI